MVASGLRNVVPLSGSTRPAAILSSVDLPDPLRPTRHRRSPAETIRSTPSRSGVPPKVSAMPPSWSSGPAISILHPVRRFHNADLERILFGWNDDFMRHRPLRSYRGHLLGVMAGLVPAIHVFSRKPARKAWMPATSAGMTLKGDSIFQRKKGRPCGWPFHCRTAVRRTDRDAWGHAAWTSVEARIQLTVAGECGDYNETLDHLLSVVDDESKAKR